MPTGKLSEEIDDGPLVPPALTLNQAAQLEVFSCRRGGARLHVATLARWIKDGSRGVHLRAQLVGGQWITCRAWIDEFLDAVTRRRLQLNPPGAVLARQRNERELRAAGALK